MRPEDLEHLRHATQPAKRLRTSQPERVGVRQLDLRCKVKVIRPGVAHTLGDHERSSGRNADGDGSGDPEVLRQRGTLCAISRLDTPEPGNARLAQPPLIPNRKDAVTSDAWSRREWLVGHRTPARIAWSHGSEHQLHSPSFPRMQAPTRMHRASSTSLPCSCRVP
jgi:hypothetical protein